MHPTIRNKLIAGFSGVMVLMAAVAGIGVYAVFSLRNDANAATRVGARLNSLALEIQVHNLEAVRKVKSYLDSSESARKRQVALEEAKFEINEIQSLAGKAVALAPTLGSRAKFGKISAASTGFDEALAKVVSINQANPGSESVRAAIADYDDAAESLHESAEDGEVIGHDASQTSLDAIDHTSSRSIGLVVGFSFLGIVLGILVSYKLSRAILLPVDHLREVAESVSLGNLDIQVRRFSEDEIGDLADSFSRMVTAVKFFRMEAELTQAELTHAEANPGGDAA